MEQGGDCEECSRPWAASGPTLSAASWPPSGRLPAPFWLPACLPGVEKTKKEKKEKVWPAGAVGQQLAVRRGRAAPPRGRAPSPPLQPAEPFLAVRSPAVPQDPNAPKRALSAYMLYCQVGALAHAPGQACRCADTACAGPHRQTPRMRRLGLQSWHGCRPAPPCSSRAGCSIQIRGPRSGA